MAKSAFLDNFPELLDISMLREGVKNILRERGVLKMEGATTSIKNGGSVDEFGTFLWGRGPDVFTLFWGECG